MQTKVLTLAIFLASSMSPLVAAPLVNLSTRAVVSTGDAAVVNEFVIKGSSPQKVLMRAVSKSRGFEGALQDPVIELYSSDGKLIIKNDDWGQAPNRQEIEDSGLAPGDPQESAILHTLAPGIYAVFLRGVGNTSGVASHELYDLGGESSITAAGSRGEVQTGENALVAGFFMTGSDPRNLLVRVLGRSLGAAGVAGALQNPTVQVIDGNGSTVGANDNWKSSQRVQIQNSGLAPTNDFEAALIAPFPPGVYTIFAQGQNNTTGVAFAQIYVLPYDGQPLDPAPGPSIAGPSRFETEALEVKATSAAQHTIINDTNLSSDAGTFLSQTVVGSFVSYILPVPAPGKYGVRVRIKTGPKRGIFRLAIGGVDQGAPQDEYTATVKYQLRDLGQVTFATAGNKVFKFTVSGKNPDSTGRTLAFDAIDLVPQ